MMAWVFSFKTRFLDANFIFPSTCFDRTGPALSRITWPQPLLPLVSSIVALLVEPPLQRTSLLYGTVSGENLLVHLEGESIISSWEANGSGSVLRTALSPQRIPRYTYREADLGFFFFKLPTSSCFGNHFKWTKRVLRFGRMQFNPFRIFSKQAISKKGRCVFGTCHWKGEAVHPLSSIPERERDESDTRVPRWCSNSGYSGWIYVHKIQKRKTWISELYRRFQTCSLHPNLQDSCCMSLVAAQHIK